MANYAALKAAIESVIKTNGNEEITGEILQNAIIALIESLGAKYQFAGIATPGSSGTNPGTPDYNVMYIADVGIYPNFGGTNVPQGSLGVFRYNGSWDYSVIDVASWADASNKLYYNTQAGNVAAKTIQADGFTLQPGGWLKVHFDNANTVDNPTLNVNNTGAHYITFNGRSVSATNSWRDGETVAFYYDNYGVGIWHGIRLVEIPDFVNINELIGQDTPFASASAARSAIPQQYRKQGLNITYLLSTGENTTQWVTDQFIGDDIDDWTVADNWKTIGPVTGTQNTLSIGGNYVGEVSTTYDVTLHNNGTTFDSLEALLSDANLNTLIPLAVRKGGMSIKFVQSSDNKYVQYFLTKDEWSASEADWQKMNLEEEVSQLGQDKLDKVFGTNLANPSKLVVGWAFSRTGIPVSLGSSYYAYYEDYLPISLGDTFIQPYTWISSQNTGCFVLYNANKDVVKTITEGNSYTCTQQDINDGVAFIRVCMRKPDAPTDYKDFYFAKASTLPPYEPYTDYKPLSDLEQRVETLEESVGDIDEIRSDIQSLEDDKLDKIPYDFSSKNLINPEHLVNGAWLVGGDSPYYTTGHPDYFIVCTDHIPVNGKNILVLSGVRDNQYIFTFLVLDASGGIRRSIYGTSNVKYTYREGDDSVMIAFNSNYFNSSYPAPFACYEDPEQPDVLLPYDEYKVESGDYKPLYDLEQRVEVLESEIGGDTAEIDNILIPKLYLISNDIAPMGENTFWNPRDLSLSVWVDRLFDWNWEDNLPRKITWKENNSDRISFVAPFSAQGSPESGVYNGGENIHIENYTKQLTTGFVDKNVSLQISSVLNSATQNLHPKVLFIGDSVTFGSGSSTPASLTRNEDNTLKIHTYWEYIWKLFYDDRKKNGNSGFAYTSLGTVKGSTFTYDGSTHFLNAEGHGGWTTADYLNVKETSPFYDANKTWTGIYATELNNAGVKFSLAKYIERYRTLDDNGERLTLGDGTGTEITSSNINNISVCTPNIVSIQLGFNDVITNSFNNIKLLVKAIKNEYPNLPIMISFIDEAGTYFPTQYTEYDANHVRLNTWTQAGSKLHHKMFTLVSQMMSDDFLIPTNGVYFCPNYFIQPTAYSLAVRECPNAASLSGFDKLPYNVEVGSGPHVHPSTIAHAAWGYQFAALIKHIIYNMSSE